MPYGSIQGVQDILLQYDTFISEGTITTDMVNRFLVKSSGQIDAILSERVSVPLAAPPQEVNNIADDLTVCQILKRHSVGKDPDETDYVKTYCVDPLIKLEDLLKENPALFDPGVSGVPLITSNRLNHDRKFTTTETENGETIGDVGTMEDW